MDKSIQKKIKLGRPVRNIPTPKRLKHMLVLLALAFRNQRVNKLNMTQEMTGSRIDKKFSFINSFECAKSNITFYSLIQLCETYEISISFQDESGNELLRLNEQTKFTASTVKNFKS